MRAKRAQNFGHADYLPKSSKFTYTRKKRTAIELASQNVASVSRFVASFSCFRSTTMTVSSKRGAEAVLPECLARYTFRAERGA